MSGPDFISVSARGGKIHSLPTSIRADDVPTGAELYKTIAKHTGLPTYQFRVSTRGGKKIADDANVKVADVLSGPDKAIQVKKLGLQIGWRTVFVLEYLGSLLIHPLWFAHKFGLWAKPEDGPLISPSYLQKITLGLVVIHFLKREYETVFVHRFSSETMPIANLFRNSAHYWLGSGLCIALEAYSQLSFISQSRLTWQAARGKSGSGPSEVVTMLGLLFFVIGESFNFVAHLKLKALRPAGTKTRGIPSGFPLFDVVTCPNYMFEILAWIGMTMVSRSIACGVFTAVAAGTMGVWARQKEAKYVQQFGDGYKRKRWVVFAPIW